MARRIKKHNGTRRNVSSTDRANILLRKEVRGPGNTNEQIAKDIQVSLTTVAHTSLYNVDDEAIKIYNAKKSKLKDLALDAVTSALIKSKELIDASTNVRSLAGVAAAGKFADSTYRLETQQPTSINAVVPVEVHALEFIRMLMGMMSMKDALEAFKSASLEPLVPEYRKAEISRRIEAGDLKLLES